MLSATCSVLVIVLTFRVTNGDSVNQTEGPVTLTEGASVILNCNYQTIYSTPYLFWYVQYRNKAPSLLLKSSTEHQTTEQHGFQAKHVKSDSSFHLEKSSLQMSDSAVYYCALRDTVREAAGGAEHKPRGARAGQPWEGLYSPSAQYGVYLEFPQENEPSSGQTATFMLEKETVTLNRVYEASSYSCYLFWYKHQVGNDFPYRSGVLHEQNATEGWYFLNCQKPASSISLTAQGLNSLFLCSKRCCNDVGACGSPRKTSDRNMRHPPAMNTWARVSVWTGRGGDVHNFQLWRHKSYEIKSGLSGEDQVEQSPQTLMVQERDSVSLTCSYTVSNFRGLQWYRQDPGKGPKHLFSLYSVGNEEQKGRLSASLSQKESSLNITTPKAEDSATYLCAVEPQCSPGTCSLYQNPAAGALE
ncbi:hypothetical protein QTO34_019481 [Cnephaeus nilssonii]|uniref:Ig-like domain-containing protein n=1 Tax=Cnephaeus nilssonii TaxID=3371016 RepID=A0AA40LP08_CNENI|nr:hypothetical protein QTO34_019481 [Eptesicus nilssonii]